MLLSILMLFKIVNVICFAKKNKNKNWTDNSTSRPKRCVFTFSCPVFGSLFTVLKNRYFHLQNKLCLHIFNF